MTHYTTLQGSIEAKWETGQTELGGTNRKWKWDRIDTLTVEMGLKSAGGLEL